MITGSRRFISNSGMGGVTLQRVRLRLGRGPEAINVTHLQQIEIIKKAVMASEWPVATSGAKRNRPRVSFGPAISVGYLSEAEYCDVELNARLDLVQGPKNLAQHLPAGYSLLQVKSIPRFFPSLDHTLNAARYHVRAGILVQTREKWEAFWAQENFFVTKKKRDREVVIDARPCVKSWDLKNMELDLCTRFGPGRTLKPEKIIQAVCGFTEEQIKLGLGEENLQVTRMQLFLEKENGALNEP